MAMHFPGQNLPRWIIFLIDVALVMFSLWAAYMLRFEFRLPDVEVGPLLFAFPIYMIVRIVLFLVGRTYAGIIRFTGTQDSVRILKVVWSGTLVMVGFNFLKFHFWDGLYFLPFSILIIDGILASALLIVFRLSIKMLYIELTNPRSERSKVLIYGAGEAGLITKRTLDRDAGTRYRVVGFLDDDPRKRGTRVEGVSVHHTDRLSQLLETGDIDHLIVSIQKPKPENRRRVISTAVRHKIHVLNVPPVSRWINGELSFKQIQRVRIEDLLGRDVIHLKHGRTEKSLKGKTVLITGAAGSIGSGLVRQVARYGPSKLIALDQAESPMYALENEVRASHPELDLEPVIGDVRRMERMKKLFEEFKPEVVFHAAAYKHVPLMELNPAEAVLTNVLGTQNLVDLSLEYNVEYFVFVSTDKAVNPTNVMGGSKRIAELYCRSSSERGNTRFVITRFGNVLGSTGSVIPLFREQIERGGPVTVTDPEVTRYFMTIPEACSLVLEAGAMGKGGEIFVFDMGESVKILDLAKQMIHLSGLQVDEDIRIEITGLRPGEKLYEELLTDEENTLPTHHPLIKIAHVKDCTYSEVSGGVAALAREVAAQNRDELVREMKKLVPEFKSNNSEFSKFDA